MYSKILIYNVTSIDVFMLNPHGTINKADSGTVVVFSNNALGFYAIALAQPLKLEKHFARQASDVMLNTQFFEEVTALSTVSIGKIAMHSSWHLDVDCHRQTALWGIILMQLVTPKELVAFIIWLKYRRESVYLHSVEAKVST